MLRKRFYIKKRCYRWPLESAFKSAFVGSFIIIIKNLYYHFSIVLHEIIKALNQSSAAVSIYEQIFVTITTCHRLLVQDLCLRSSGPLPPSSCSGPPGQFQDFFIRTSASVHQYSFIRTTTTTCHRRNARWNHKVCCIRNHNNIQHKVTQLSSRYFNF